MLSKNGLNLLKQNRFYGIIIIGILIVSCAYQYLSYAMDIEEQKMEMESTKQEYRHIRWHTIESIINIINKNGILKAKLASNIFVNRLNDNYSSMDELAADLQPDLSNTPRLNKAIIDTVTRDEYLGHMSNRDGIFISTDNRVLYSIITPQDSIHSSWNDFIESNYNQELAKKTYTLLRIPVTTGIKLLEPYPPIAHVSDHMLISSSTLEELQDVYYKEGISGLSGYLLLSSYFIYDDEKGLKLSEYNIQGNHLSNKIAVTSYISIYDAIVGNYTATFNTIDEMERRALEQDKIEENKIYYNSIKSLLFHIVCIVLVLLITRNQTNNIIKTDGDQ